MSDIYGKYLNLKQNEGKAEAAVAGVKQATDFVYNIAIFSHFVVYEAYEKQKPIPRSLF